MLLFIIQIEPLLSTLFNRLPSISFRAAMESVFTYVDDVDIFGQSEEDLLLANTICSQFEAMSGGIVNRKQKVGHPGPLHMGWPPKLAFHLAVITLHPSSLWG